jgi:hypothetical protein
MDGKLNPKAKLFLMKNDLRIITQFMLEASKKCELQSWRWFKKMLSFSFAPLPHFSLTFFLLEV